MAIFGSQTSAAEKKEHIANIASGALNSLINSVRASYDAVWNTPGVAPQSIIDQFGTDAAELFDVSRKTQLFIKSIKPDYELLLPPLKVTANPDGTVTIGDAI